MALPLPDDTYIHWDSNSTFGRLAYCNGMRNYSENFFIEIPSYLIVNVEAVQSINIIPDEIAVRDGKTYRFVGVTLHRYGKLMANHYTLMMSRRNGEKLYYDGLNVIPLEKSPINSKRHSLQHCLYILLPDQ